MYPTLTDTPTTWAGLAPTHPISPPSMRYAVAASTAAWQTVDVIIEAGLAAQSLDSALIHEAQAAAQFCDDLKLAEYTAWNADIALRLDPEYVREPSQYDEHSWAWLP